MPRFLEPVGQAIRAIITETAESRDGSQRGVNGINEPREFRVILTIPEQDRTELRMPDPRGFVEAEIPYGSLHPWNGYARVTGYGPVRRITAQHYLVGVQYGVGGPMGGTIQPDHRRWSLAVRSQAITQKIVEEPTQALGSWREAFGLEGTRKARALATQKFIPISDTEIDPEATQYWTKLWERITEGTGVNARVKVVEKIQRLAKAGDQRTPFDYTAELPGMMFTLTRVFPNFPLDGLGELADYRATVNNTPFKGASIGHVKMADFSVDEVAMVIDDGSTQGEPGIANRIMLAFLWSSIPFIPVRKVPTYRDEHNDQAVVYEGDPPTGEKVVEEFYPIRGMDFDAMIEFVESLSTRLRSPGAIGIVP